MAWARKARRKGDFPRDTFRVAVDLLLVFGGAMIPFKIPRPAPSDKSRFLSDAVNYLTIRLLKDIQEVRELYSEEEWTDIDKMEIYSAFFYIPWLSLG